MDKKRTMEQPSTSKQSSGHDGQSHNGNNSQKLLEYAHSEYSLYIPKLKDIKIKEDGYIENDGDDRNNDTINRENNEASDEGNCTDDEMELAITKLNDFPEMKIKEAIISSCPQQSFAIRQYVDYNLCRASNVNVDICGGAETPVLSPNPTPQELQYEKESRKAKEQQKYRRLQRLAIVCPSNACQEVINAANLLSHFLECHLTTPCREIYSDQEIDIALNSQLFLNGTPKGNCAAVLLFENLKYCIKNANLKKEMSQKWSRHLPILLMVQKCSWDSVIQTGHTVNQFYAIWLFCLEAHLSLRITLPSASSHGGDKAVMEKKDLLNVKQQIVHTCSSVQFIQKWDLLSDGPNILRLTHGEMKELTKDFKGTLKLELIVCDEPSELAKDAHEKLYKSQNAEEQQTTIRDLGEKLARLTISEDNNDKGGDDSKDDSDEDDKGINKVDSLHDNSTDSRRQKRSSDDEEISNLPYKKLRPMSIYYIMKKTKVARKSKSQEKPKHGLNQFVPFTIKWVKSMDTEIKIPETDSTKSEIFVFGKSIENKIDNEKTDEIDETNKNDEKNDESHNIQSDAIAQNITE